MSAKPIVEAEPISEFPSAEELLIKTPLYTSLKLGASRSANEALYAFMNSDKRLDIFCPQCKRECVMSGGRAGVEIKTYDAMREDRSFTKTFHCQRDPSHTFRFIFEIQNGFLQKIGQYPSMADIDEGHVSHYRGVLDRSHYRELSRAIALTSHGVGIGSFVYLRRIFEDLVEDAHGVAQKTDGWDDTSYEGARMSDKIQILRHFLPEFLVEQRVLYGIMSKGIHELSEEECLSHFPVVKAGIEIILDQRLAEKKQKQKLEDAKKAIGKITSSMKPQKQGDKGSS